MYAFAIEEYKLGEHMRRIFVSLTFLGLIVVVLASTVLGIGSVLRENAANASWKSNPVLFIHGISSASSDDCTRWNTAKSSLRGQGWSGDLTSIQYYTNDTNCDTSLESEAFHCTAYHDSGMDNGTSNEDLRHVSCKFAWYIWDHYTQYGRNVQIVAHSMGGLITRWALYVTTFERDFPPAEHIFPPYLLVRDIVTMGTPHHGAPNGYALLFCHDCLQGLQLETSSIVMQQLIDNGQNPQGSMETDWTMIGSRCDIVNVVSSNDSESMSGGHKILFQTPCYKHSDYMKDASNNIDAVAKRCDGVCGPSHIKYMLEETAPHALRDMYLALNAQYA